MYFLFYSSYILYATRQPNNILIIYLFHDLHVLNNECNVLSSVIYEPSCSFILKGPCTSLTVWVIYRRYDPVYHIVSGLYCVLLSLIFVRIYFKVSKCTFFSYFQYRYSLISILGIAMC